MRTVYVSVRRLSRLSAFVDFSQCRRSLICRPQPRISAPHQHHSFSPAPSATLTAMWQHSEKVRAHLTDTAERQFTQQGIDAVSNRTVDGHFLSLWVLRAVTIFRVALFAMLAERLVGMLVAFPLRTHSHVPQRAQFQRHAVGLPRARHLPGPPPVTSHGRGRRPHPPRRHPVDGARMRLHRNPRYAFHKHRDRSLFNNPSTVLFRTRCLFAVPSRLIREPAVQKAGAPKWATPGPTPTVKAQSQDGYSSPHISKAPGTVSMNSKVPNTPAFASLPAQTTVSSTHGYTPCPNSIVLAALSPQCHPTACAKA